MAPLLEIRGLTVQYWDAGEPTRALAGLDLGIEAGQRLGILGESGCGKTTLALTLLGLLPVNGRIAAGSVLFRGRELVDLEERQWQRLRGAEISLVFQEPALALHPTRRAGQQIAEVLRAHRAMDRRQRRDEVRRLLAEVGLGGEPQLQGAYPHQLSGGQRQRVVLAQALACRPARLIADEPTAALDATTEARILALLCRLCDEHGTTLVIISHDPRVLRRMARRVAVIHQGRVVEEGDAAAVLETPSHPHTAGLLACEPRLPPAPKESVDDAG